MGRCGGVFVAGWGGGFVVESVCGPVWAHVMIDVSYALGFDTILFTFHSMYLRAHIRWVLEG